MPAVPFSSRSASAVRSAALRVLCVVAFATPAPAAWAAWPSSAYLNLPVATGAGNQSLGLVACSDGLGGAIVAWGDTRTDFAGDVYAMHILAKGVVDPAWPVNGRAVCALSGNQLQPAIVPDGSGGAIVTWSDARVGQYDVYAHHVLANGTLDPAWPSTGRQLVSSAGEQSGSRAVADGAGGAIVVWSDFRSGDRDVYATRVRASGTVDPAWPANGQALCVAVNYQYLEAVCGDGAGGAFAGWTDWRTGTGNYEYYATHVGGNGTIAPGWNSTSGNALRNGTAYVYGLTLCSDGGYGAYAVWQDDRAGRFVYAHHLLSSGGVDPQWTANGNLVSTSGNWVDTPVVAPDGAGGCYAAWKESSGGFNDVRVQRLTPTGLPASGWPAAGTLALSQPGQRYLFGIAGDGGGAIVGMLDLRSGYRDVYATRVRANGAVDPLWATGGTAVCTATGEQYAGQVVSDLLGGAIVLWPDLRNATDGTSDLYAQRITRTGYLGTPEGEILSVRDVPNDEGGRCKVTFAASYLDLASDPNVAQYNLYRSAAPNVVAEAVREGARVYASFDDVPPVDAASAPPGEDGLRLAGPETRTFVQPSGAQAYGWELYTSIGCQHFLPSYGVIVQTTGDSTAAYNPKTAWMTVLYGYYTPDLYFMSYPDSGYSADNLAPVAPAPFTGQYAAGTSVLHWDPNAEPDLAGYRLYRGSSPSFVPSLANRVAAVEDTGYVDVAVPPSFYKLSAVDLHGNESPFTLLMPTGTVDAPVAGLALELAPPTPNPAAGDATFRFALPRAAPAELAVFDAGGRLVKRLASGTRDAGAHAVRWDLRGEDGARVRAGLYFVRLSTAAGTRMRRLATLE